MVETDQAKSLFIACARRIALARCLPDADRRGAGVVLLLNRSQFARDGLTAAAKTFARLVEERGIENESATALAIALARKAPTEVWWRAEYAASKPARLDRHDVWASLEELRILALPFGDLAVAHDPPNSGLTRQPG